VTRQLRYSRDETQLALDLGLFINGLPVATFELKNSLTKQTVEDAVEQYKRDRELFKQLMDNESFRRWLTDTVFGLTYEKSASSPYSPDYAGR